MVLTCLVLVTALAISLLTRVQADRTGAAAYRGGATSRNLAEYAVNVVMAQISSATSGTNAGNAWASQPGALRTFNSSGNLVSIYKLYSSTNMVVSSFPTADTNLAGWTNNTALYTDLNAPVISSSGTSGMTNTNYPILNPNATNSVEGFSINSSAPTSSNQAAPMPVNWLYLLQNGTLVAPTSGSGNTVTVAGASASNPITGRIAFWADDETCKININTASGMPWWWTTNRPAGTSMAIGSYPLTATLYGNYWDTPIFGSPNDQSLSYSQPWQGEFQRFPGHPATVSLSAVFTNLSTNDIMQVSPRISYTSSGAIVGSQWGASQTTSTGSNIPSDGARLYADPDELLYSTNRSATGTNSLTPDQISRGRFFLTAVSRAPDVTLFNTPRLVMWPITYSTNSSAIVTNKMTPFDRLIAFCGTVGADTNIGSTNSYYFTRSQPYSNNFDYNIARNQSLLTYLGNLTATAVPGYGNSSGGSGILGKYPFPEQIRTEIFDYIRCLNLQDNSVFGAGTNYYYTTNGLVVPTAGVGGTWGYGRMPVITKAGILFWYGTTNNTTPNNTYSSSSGNIYYPATMCAQLVVEGFTAAHGMPQIRDLSDFTITVTGLTNSGFTWGPTNGTSATNQLFSSNTVTYANPILVPTNTYGSPQWGGVLPITMYTNGNSNAPFMTSLTFSGGSLRGPGLNSNTTAVTGNGVWLYGPGFINRTNAANCFYQGGIVSTNNRFLFRGGTVTISTSYRGIPLQTLSSITFPPPTGTMILNYPTASTTTNPSFPSNGWNGWNANGSLIYRAGRSAIEMNERDPILTNDVILSTQLASGDYRMEPTVGSSSVPGTTWMTHPYYGVTNFYAHTFRHSTRGVYYGATMIANAYSASTNLTLVRNGADSSARSNWDPARFQAATYANGDLITNSTNGGATLLTRFGDFDNGIGCSPDAPYIGFADEGGTTTNPTGSQTVPYYSWGGAPSMINVPGFFSPNRLVPSAGILGSLPTGVNPTNVAASSPWQTLLFRPAALTAAGHPGLANPPDYLLLDLFNMPVVQPYAISEPLSTAGRINMNYQILPFTYIRRNTAVMAALHTEMLTAADGLSVSRKEIGNFNLPTRFPLDLTTNTGTLAGFEQRFETNGIFVSAAEICSIPLVPYVAGVSATYSGMTSWWSNANRSVNGDNTKERPYARIYPKLTTKSNVYTVHYTVQVLKQVSPRSTPWTTWNEATDKVLATYRGATTIERYVNPRDPAIKDYTGVTLPLQPNDANALPYKFRIIGERRFNP